MNLVGIHLAPGETFCTGILQPFHSSEGFRYAMNRQVCMRLSCGQYLPILCKSRVDRLSGLWHDDTPLSQHLKSKGITSLLFTGVNTDQCVFGTLLDAFHRGYDTLLVSDLCCTPTPSYTTEMVVYSASCESSLDRSGNQFEAEVVALAEM